MTSASVRDAAATDWRSALSLGIIFLVTVWATILGHEAAHFGVGRLLYLPADLATGRVPNASHIATVTAGPVFTLLTVVGSVLVIGSVQTRSGRTIVSSVVGSSVSRLLLTAPPTLLGHGGNDERTLGTLTGISPRLLWGLEAVLIVWGIVAVAKHLPSSERWSTLWWVIIALVVGWATAFPLGRAVGLPI